VSTTRNQGFSTEFLFLSDDRVYIVSQSVMCNGEYYFSMYVQLIGLARYRGITNGPVFIGIDSGH